MEHDATPRCARCAGAFPAGQAVNRLCPACHEAFGETVRMIEAFYSGLDPAGLLSGSLGWHRQSAAFVGPKWASYTWECFGVYVAPVPPMPALPLPYWMILGAGDVIVYALQIWEARAYCPDSDVVVEARWLPTGDFDVSIRGIRRGATARDRDRFWKALDIFDALAKPGRPAGVQPLTAAQRDRLAAIKRVMAREGVSLREAARRWGLPESTVRTWLDRDAAALRE